MPRPGSLACFVVFTLAAAPALAQDDRPGSTTAPPTTASSGVTNPVWMDPSRFTLDAPTPAPFRALGGDFKRFFGDSSNLRLLAAFGAATALSVQWDDAGMDTARQFHTRSFDAGNVAGGTYAQAGFAAGTWLVGKATRSASISALGGDLMEAQLVTQTVVQGLKHTVRRTRPDGSNNVSFPSGHTASAFATASVLQRHYGWKIGVPAYAFGAYVATARLAADKHHLSDVLMGAGIGLVAGRAVTVGVGGQRFDLGIAPTAGRGAMVTFTRK